jgi:hypothetical protein
MAVTVPGYAGSVQCVVKLTRFKQIDPDMMLIVKLLTPPYAYNGMPNGWKLAVNYQTPIPIISTASFQSCHAHDVDTYHKRAIARITRTLVAARRRVDIDGHSIDINLNDVVGVIASKRAYTQAERERDTEV